MEPEDDKPDVSEENPESERWLWMGPFRPPIPKALVKQMSQGWAEHPTVTHSHPATSHNAKRRRQLSAAFPGKTLVIPTGILKVRSNDTDYNFRPGTDFYWLTASNEPDCVLVMHPEGDSHRAVLYLEPRGDRSSHRFFTDARYGELWRGPRMGTSEVAQYLQLDTASLEQLETDLAAIDATNTLTVRDMDPRVDKIVAENSSDFTLTQTLNDLRLTKDDFEVEQLQKAVNATIKGFEDVVRAMPEAMERGERVVEGIFNLRARVEGNDVGYSTIAASGAHASILHWTRNDGDVGPSDLLLLDAGVESHELYTADVTRTLPVSGKYSPAQREIYTLVWQAQKAALAMVKPGANFLDPHRAAMVVLAEGLHQLGILKVDPQTALRRDNQTYRRWTLHGTSHMLGIDVHDCSHARDECYMGGELKPGYVLTVEPGLYFQIDDLEVPEKYRGIGVRIEDDVLVTQDGCRVLSAALPTDPDEIERWMARLSSSREPGSTSILS